ELLVGQNRSIQRAVTGTSRLLWDPRDHAPNDFLSLGGIALKVGNHHLDGHMRLIHFPAVVIRHHRHRRVGDLGLARAFGFAEVLQRPDVRTMVQFARENAVPATVTRQEDDRTTGQFPGQKAVRRRAKGRRYLLPFLLAETFDVIKTAAADNADAMGSHKVEMRNKDKIANEPPLRCIDADAETSGVQTDKLVMAFN